MEKKMKLVEKFQAEVVPKNPHKLSIHDGPHLTYDDALKAGEKVMRSQKEGTVVLRINKYYELVEDFG